MYLASILARVFEQLFPVLKLDPSALYYLKNAPVEAIYKITMIKKKVPNKRYASLSLLALAKNVNKTMMRVIIARIQANS
jgi:hypothetical protein